MAKKGIPKKTIKIVLGYTKRLSKEDKLPIDKVIVFGSRAKGSFHGGSDIDVCIISPRFENNLKALEFLWTKRKREEVIAGLEPVGFSSKDFKRGSSLIQEIKKTGVAIK